MRKICNWLQDVAREGAGPTPSSEVEQHIAKLGELGSNWASMSGRQFKEVMTTAHFSDYFGRALDVAFRDRYDRQLGQWRNYVYMDTAPDFRDVQRFRQGMGGGLYRRGEKGEAEATYLQHEYIEYGLDEWARQIDISWRVMLNDDLGEIQRIPEYIAEIAALWLDEWVSNLYDNATFQATVAALGYPWAGTGRLTLANLALGINAMMQRTDTQGKRIAFPRLFLVIPPILQIQAQTILRDLLSYGGPGGNILGSFVAGVYVDPYIAFAGANVPWYLFAEPSMACAPVTVARLAGIDGPFVTQKDSDIRVVTGAAPAALLAGNFATGDIEYMVEDIVGGWDDASYAGVTDVNGVFYSSGTTP